MCVSSIALRVCDPKDVFREKDFSQISAIMMMISEQGDDCEKH